MQAGVRGTKISPTLLLKKMAGAVTFIGHRFHGITYNGTKQTEQRKGTKVTSYGNAHTVAIQSGGTVSANGIHRAARIMLFICFTALGAQLAFRLPFSPVPVTLQTLFVVLAGITLGARDGFYAIAAYLALGAAGVPLFAGFTAGPLVFLGPTGGYLVAFPAAALLSGRLVECLGRSRPALFAASLAGCALILSFGTLHLSVVLDLGLSTALALGALPFVAGEGIKAAVAAVVAR